MTLANDNFWNDLSTISTLDTGSPPGDRATDALEIIDNEDAPPSSRRRRRPPVATPISLLVQSLVRQLCVLLEKDRERARRLYTTICDKLHEMRLLDATYERGEFEEMRRQYQTALGQLVRLADEAGDFASADLFGGGAVWPIRPSAERTWSRYRREFDEQAFIARGGFGAVYKARNKLDGVQYAVKKVVLPARDIDAVSKHLDEVKTFASLNHPNVVAYKSAWLEPVIDEVEPVDQGSHSSSVFDESSYYLSKNHSDDFEVLFEEESGVASKNNNNSMSGDECKALVKLDAPPAHVNLRWATLYIQMALCEQTLKAWLDERNARDESPPDFETAIDVLAQLAHGVDYIHGLRIVHHDVKPTNVFVGRTSAGLRVQLADFGLACPSQEARHVPAPGTCVYAAPEQMRGHCHVKNDLFSVGLIMLELVEIFRTHMEKIETFKSLREGRVPLRIAARSPQLAQLIGKLAENDLKKRLDCKQLLCALKALKDNKDETIKNLQTEMETKNEIIHSQQEEISNLKRLLELNNIKL